MANTAFEHSPTITVPGSGNSTDNAVVLWNGTTGNNFSNSTIIVGATTMGLAADTNLLTFGDTTLAIAGAVTGVLSLVVDDITINGTSITTIASDNNINITPNGTGSVVISKVDINAGDITGVTISGGLTWSAAQTFGAVTATQVDITAQGDLRLQDNTGGQYIAFDSPATVSTSYTVTMPAGLPVADKVLKVTSISSNIATMEWGEAGAALTPWTSNIDTDGYDLITDDSNKDINIIPHGTGKVGIGHASPGHLLHVEGPGGWLAFLNATTNSAQVSCLYAHTASEHSDTSIAAFHSGSSYKMRVYGDGNVAIHNGNLIMGTPGKGIDFSAQTQSTAYTASAEVLNHYEEGSWTPIMQDNTGANATSYHTQIARYTRIGSRVFIQCQLHVDTMGISGTTGRIAGLPFPSNATTGRVSSMAMGRTGGLNVTAGHAQGAVINENVSYITLHNFDAVAGSSGLLISEIGNDGNFTISGHYEI